MSEKCKRILMYGLDLWTTVVLLNACHAKLSWNNLNI